MLSPVLAAAGVGSCTGDEQNSPLYKRAHRDVWWRSPVVLACEPLAGCPSMLGMLEIPQPIWGLYFCLSMSSPCWPSGTDARYLPEEV